MSFSKIAGAAVLLALAPSTLALGSATVINNCGFPVYYASVAQSVHAGMQEMQGSYSEQYGSEGVGISIKLSDSMDGQVTQFEFTLAGDKINYDLSNIDGYPFVAGGMTLTPSMSGDSSNPSCVPVDCPAGVQECTAAYNQPDDVDTKVCNSDADLVLTICPAGSPAGSGESSSSSESTPSSTEAATATESATATEASAPAESSSTGGWGRPGKRDHAHGRVHSRAFIV